MPPNPAYPDARIVRAWRLVFAGFAFVFTIAAAIALYDATQSPVVVAGVLGSLAIACALVAWRASDATMARWGAIISGFGT